MTLKQSISMPAANWIAWLRKNNSSTAPFGFQDQAVYLILHSMALKGVVKRLGVDAAQTTKAARGTRCCRKRLSEPSIREWLKN